MAIKDVLKKASVDNFEYMVKLKTGESIFFRQAKIDFENNEVELHEIEPDFSEGLPAKTYLDRGISVCLDEIVWAADAPYGS